MRVSTPITKEAKEYLQRKLERMRGLEKKKAIKRCEMYDRGYRAKETKHVDYDFDRNG